MSGVDSIKLELSLLGGNPMLNVRGIPNQNLRGKRDGYSNYYFNLTRRDFCAHFVGAQIVALYLKTINYLFSIF